MSSSHLLRSTLGAGSSSSSSSFDAQRLVHEGRELRDGRIPADDSDADSLDQDDGDDDGTRHDIVRVDGKFFVLDHEDRLNVFKLFGRNVDLFAVYGKKQGRHPISQMVPVGPDGRTAVPLAPDTRYSTQRRFSTTTGGALLRRRRRPVVSFLSPIPWVRSIWTFILLCGALLMRFLRRSKAQ